MSYIDNFVDKDKNASEYSKWPIHENGFDRTFSQLYPGTLTTCAVLDGGRDLARFFAVHGPFNRNGWKNIEKSKNVMILENAYDIASKLNEIQKEDKRIHIPGPHGLFLVRQRPFESLHPAFVMDHIPNHFLLQDENKKQEILQEGRDMLEILEKEYGFDVGPHSWHFSNLIYNEDIEGGRTYVVGFGAWKKE